MPESMADSELEAGTARPSTSNRMSTNIEERIIGIPAPGPAMKDGSAPVFNEQTNYLPTGKVVGIFISCALVDFVALMDQTTLAASLSIIGNELGASTEVAWIAGGYFVTSTAFQLIYGRLSDIWSRKLVLLVGFAVFFLGSLASSLAQTVGQLIAFRAITGIGGGGLMTVAQMIVSDVVSLRERGKYQGIFGVFVALSNGIGPVIGAALAVHDWRWIFRLNLPLTVLCVIGVIFFMPLKRVEGDWREKIRAIDFVGAGAALSGTTLLVLSLTWAGGDYSWTSGHVVGTLAMGLAVMAFFFVWQWKGAKLPLVPLHIFKSRVVNGATVTMFINGWNFVVQVYYIPTFYQLAYGYSPVKAASLLLPITLFQTLSSTVSGLIISKTGRYRENILFGWTCWAIGLGLFATLDERSGLGKQIGFGILTGIGVGQTLQPSLVAIQAGVERKDMAVVTAFRNFIRNLGATLGLAVAGSIVNNTLRQALVTHFPSDQIAFLLNNPNYILHHHYEILSELNMTSPALSRRAHDPSLLPDTNGAFTDDQVRKLVFEAYRTGFRYIFALMAGLAAAAFFAAVIFLPQVSLDRSDDKKLKEEGKEFDKSLREKKDSQKAGSGAATAAEPRKSTGNGSMSS